MKAIIFLMMFFSHTLFAQEGLTIVAVGEATLEKHKVIIQDAYMGSGLSTLQQQAANDLVTLVRNDLAFYKKLFNVLGTGKNPSASRPSTNYGYWKQNGLSYLGTVEVAKSGDNLNITMIFDDIRAGKEVFRQTKSASIATLREVGHSLTDGFFRVATGNESVFNSKIAFVSDRNSKGKKTVKEIYIMDFDGKNVRQITNHGGITISPAVSTDGRYMVYSLISNSNKNRNNDLYLMDLRTRETRVISDRKGINSGAVFLRDGKSIALTLTMSGNAEIYEMNLITKELRKITNHFALDVDPAVTPDGSLMTFLSNRPGKAMIYTMNPNGTENDVKRISFVGQFNATPRFSPNGKEIVFASWLDNSFDLFRINANGQGLSRLTKNFGSNEDPTYSNDGQFIAFTSQRVISRSKADQNIYIMDRDGDILGAITGSFGNCLSPRWFNPSK